MAMRCQSCGSANTKGSKFCSSCGARLKQSTKGRCPECGTFNSLRNVFCDECGARLAPAAPGLDDRIGEGSVRGLSLPRREPTPDEDSPDWLAELRSTFTEPSREETDKLQAAAPLTEGGASPVESPPPPADDDMPGWLRDISQPSDVADTSVEPGASPAVPGVGAGEVPTWLQEALEKPDSASDSRPVDDTGSPHLDADELPDWMADLSPETDQDTESEPGDLPSWLQEAGPQDTPSDIPSAADEEGAPEPGELPDRLQEAKPLETPPDPQPTAAADEGADIEPAELLDWLREVAPKETSPELAPEAGMGVEIEPGELPDWLQETLAADDTAIEPDELPDWLAKITPEETAPELEVAADEDTEIEPDELPDWLEKITPEAEETAPAAEDAETESGELPAWLDKIAPQETQPDVPQATDEEPEIEPGELPAWLEESEYDDASPDSPAPLIPDADRPDGEPEKPAPPASTIPSQADTLTDWLGATAPLADSQLAPTQPMAGTGPLVPPELPDWLAAVDDSAATGLPEWLVEDDDESIPPAADSALPTPGLAQEALPAPPDAAPPEEEADSLPSWLSQTEADFSPIDEARALKPIAMIDEPSIAGGEARVAPAGLPDWLASLDSLAELEELAEETAPEMPDRLPADGEAPPVEPELPQAAIPEWLQALKPKELVDDVTGAGGAAGLEPAETDGLLQGVRGALVAEAIVSAPPATRAPTRLAVTEQQQAHTKALEQIIRPGLAPKPPSTAALPAWERLERAAIPIIVFLAILLPTFLGGSPLTAGDASAVPPPGITDTFNLIERMPDSALAVVAFDYSPAEAGELEPLSSVLVRHLMSRGARILAVSTTPTGSEIAQGVLDKLSDDYGYVYGTDYLNLGYVPGGAAGLQAFAATPWRLFSGADYLGITRASRAAQAASSLTDSLADADLILIVTAARDDLAAWIEQVGRLPDMEKVGMAAGVSAGLEPWVRPYYQSDAPQLSGLVSGIPGASQYEFLINQQYSLRQSHAATNVRDGQTVGLAAVSLMIAAGLVWGTASSLIDRRRGNG